MNNKSLLTKKIVVLPLTIFCCLLWGSAFPCIKLGCRFSAVSSDDTASQIFYAGLRFTLAGILALILGSIIERKLLVPKISALEKAAKLSLFQTILQYTFFYIGLSRSTGMKSSVITASNVFLSILVAALVFRTEKLTLRKIVGCLIGFSGVLLINLGGIGGGTSEIARRFIPEYRRNNIVNPLLNTMPDWIPEHLRIGDAYSSIPKGEARLPAKYRLQQAQHRLQGDYCCDQTLVLPAVCRHFQFQSDWQTFEDCQLWQFHRPVVPVILVNQMYLH